MHEVIYHPEADAEVVTAAQFYESCQPGLGRDFLQELEQAVESIRLMPETWPVLEADIRRRLLKRFPYGILYRVTLDGIRILAVAHLRRRPGYWKERVGR